MEQVVIFSATLMDIVQEELKEWFEDNDVKVIERHISTTSTICPITKNTFIQFTVMVFYKLNEE